MKLTKKKEISIRILILAILKEIYYSDSSDLSITEGNKYLNEKVDELLIEIMEE